RCDTATRGARSEVSSLRRGGGVPVPAGTIGPELGTPSKCGADSGRTLLTPPPHPASGRSARESHARETAPLSCLSLSLRSRRRPGSADLRRHRFAVAFLFASLAPCQRVGRYV